MKNIFEFIMTEEGTLNENVFESFSNWMFEGDDITNRLSRIFLYWSILYVIQNAGNGNLDNENFYSFFQDYDRTDFDSFLNHISKDPIIAESVEHTLGSDQANVYYGDNQSTYWYYIGIITDRIDNRNLFPDQPAEKSNVLEFGSGNKKASAPSSAADKNQLSDKDRKSVTNTFKLIFMLLIFAYLFYNFFL